MKKTLLVLAAALSLAAFARPHGGPGFGRPGPWRGGPHYHHYHHHHHGAGAFWTGVGIGLVGSALLPPPPPPPVVVTAPAAVWVPPVYGERPVYRAGIWVGTERYVITPGYWR